MTDRPPVPGAFEFVCFRHVVAARFSQGLDRPGGRRPRPRRRAAWLFPWSMPPAAARSRSAWSAAAAAAPARPSRR